MSFVHHSSGSHCYTLDDCSAVVRAIQRMHMDSNGWDDIGYNFLVGEDGRVYEGRGWTTLPAHSPVYNYFSHGTCIMGDYMTAAPEEGYIIPDYELFGHRDGRCTDCPGDVLYSIIQTWPHYSFREIPIIC
ncbi:hypothetical protein LSH36_586g01011 [Paralvinella palmiformis]|uniref:Peptidoglycan recognition protein family domain-containing protein n=1 Tax=Paralvinella palmiformis TaxID=53620 RepID=A0AAD9J633_9ANNE|nr:hypothetical protein LSH36_586g01011 [Paralvinella palmiformis]